MIDVSKIDNGMIRGLVETVTAEIAACNSLAATVNSATDPDSLAENLRQTWDDEWMNLWRERMAEFEARRQDMLAKAHDHLESVGAFENVGDPDAARKDYAAKHATIKQMVALIEKFGAGEVDVTELPDLTGLKGSRKASATGSTSGAGTGTPKFSFEGFKVTNSSGEVIIDTAKNITDLSSKLVKFGKNFTSDGVRAAFIESAGGVEALKALPAGTELNVPVSVASDADANVSINVTVTAKVRARVNA